MKVILIIGAVVILAAMLSYAVYLLVRLQRQKKLLQLARDARFNRIQESIEIIAQAMLSQQCNSSEGVLRLKPLLDVLGQKKLSDYPAMWALYQVVMDMPIFDERKSLPRNQRMKLDLTREASEAEYEPKIYLEARQLLSDIKIFRKG